MSTKLYFHAALPNPAVAFGHHSAALPVGTFSNFSFFRRSMNTTIGNSVVTDTANSLAQTAHQDNFFESFTSPPLNAQIVASNTWSWAMFFQEGSTNSNSFVAGSLYVWRPSTSSVVGYIYDSDTALGNEWGTLPRGRTGSFLGSQVVCQDNDLLVFELWRHASQAQNIAYAQSFSYDGTVEPTENGSATDAASYILTPQTIQFFKPKLYPFWYFR